MTDQTALSDYPRRLLSHPSHGVVGPSGSSYFAGIIMILAGGFQTLAGLVALFQDEFYVTTLELRGEVQHHDLGLDPRAACSAGAGSRASRCCPGKVWARTVGVVLAVLSALANFSFIPYYPFWSLILIITLDVFVIWALTAHGRDVVR